MIFASCQNTATEIFCFFQTFNQFHQTQKVINMVRDQGNYVLTGLNGRREITIIKEFSVVDWIIICMIMHRTDYFTQEDVQDALTGNPGKIHMDVVAYIQTLNLPNNIPRYLRDFLHFCHSCEFFYCQKM